MLRQRKVPKRKATPLSASPALRYGATCGARVWRGLAQLAPLRVAQTHASPDPPNPALLGASRGAPGYRTATRAFAALGPISRVQAPRAAQPGPSAAMARGAVWMFGCPTPAGCACGGAVVGWHARRSARASCSDSPWMSERRAAAQSEFHGAPRNRPDAGVPRSEAQGSQTGGRLFFGDFLLAKQKKVTRTPGDSRPPPSTQASSPISPTTRYYKINSYQPISH